jgi:hypothetical protein
MDHIVYLDAGSGEIENLLHGKKSMIIRGSHGRRMPHGNVNLGDNLYFIDNACDGEIRAKGTVSSVFCSEMLTVEESFEIIIRNQDKLQLPDNQFDRIAGKRFLILIGLENIIRIEQFRFNNIRSLITDDWLPIGCIEEFISSGQGIISA